jgi:group II intron reverse transcriptase/maturase
MNGDGNSDKPIVSGKPANKGDAAASLAERVERRGLAKGNLVERDRSRTQSQTDLHHGLDRIRQKAKEDGKERFTALWHHVYNLDRLRQAYHALKREAAPGVDGETWVQYGNGLETRLEELSERLQRGSYRAKPVKRVYIPKSDGRLRPIGITALEDKIVQRATTEVLNAVYEVDFLGFSYGFRPGRSQHNALDAVTVAIEQRRVRWVLDADIRGFFDKMDHDWMMRFLEHRIADRRVHRHIKKWLNAGILEDGVLRAAAQGVPQGGSLSPLLANIYLHYTLDLWAERWRRTEARGEVYLVRYADDFIVGFQYKEDADLFHAQLRERLGKFTLELNEEKTRLIEFGRFACLNRSQRGEGKPETFDFLGFTHICGKTRQGKFCVQRKSARKKVQSKLRAVKDELRKRLNRRIAEVGQWLNAVLLGHYRYYGVPRNYRSLNNFRRSIVDLWRRALRRRGNKTHTITWERMDQLAERWLPRPRIVHPYPHDRLRVTTQGRSPVR